jgi:hypothetical protein
MSQSNSRPAYAFEVDANTIRRLLEAGNALATLLDDIEAGSYDGDLAQERIAAWEAALLDVGRQVS